MDGAPPTDARGSPCEAAPVGVCIARLRKKRSQRSCLDCRGGRTPESSGTGGFNWPVGNLAVRTKSQTDLAGNEDIYFRTSRSLPALDWPAGGTRPQPIRREIKIPSPLLKKSFQPNLETQ